MVFDLTNIDNIIRSYVLNIIHEKFPSIDTTPNSAYDELFIGPIIEVVRPFIEKINRMELLGNLDNAEVMTEEELDFVANGNYFMERRTGEKAIGFVTFSFSNISTDEDFKIKIPAGTTLETSTELEFVIENEKIITQEDFSEGYNKTTLTYDIDVDVAAIDIGTKYNVQSGEIVTCKTDFSNNLIGITNKVGFENGKDKESNVEFASRIRDWYLSRQLGTKGGYKDFMLSSSPEINDVFVVGYNDEYMDRDLFTIIDKVTGELVETHIGGKVDIYIKGSKYVESEAFSVSRGPVILTNINYENIDLDTDVILYNLTDNSKVPVIKLVDKVGPGEYLGGAFADCARIIIENTDNVSYDSSTINTMKLIYKYRNDSSEFIEEELIFEAGSSEMDLSAPVISILGLDTIGFGEINNIGNKYDLISEGIIGTSQEVSKIKLKNIDDVPNGVEVRCKYVSNDTVMLAAQKLNEEENRIITTDVLVREASAVYVNIQMRVKLEQNRSVYDLEVIRAKIKASVLKFLDKYKLGDDVEESDMIAWLYNDMDVKNFIQYIALPLDVFYIPINIDEDIPTDGTEHAPNGVLPIKAIEYPILNSSKFKVDLL